MRHYSRTRTGTEWLTLCLELVPINLRSKAWLFVDCPRCLAFQSFKDDDMKIEDLLDQLIDAADKAASADKGKAVAYKHAADLVQTFMEQAQPKPAPKPPMPAPLGPAPTTDGGNS